MHCTPRLSCSFCPSAYPKHCMMKICVDRTILYVGVGILCVYQRSFFCGLLCILGTIILSCAVETYFCELNDTSLTQVRQINTHSLFLLFFSVSSSDIYTFLHFSVFLGILSNTPAFLHFVFSPGSSANRTNVQPFRDPPRAFRPGRCQSILS